MKKGAGTHPSEARQEPSEMRRAGAQWIHHERFLAAPSMDVGDFRRSAREVSVEA